MAVRSLLVPLTSSTEGVPFAVIASLIPPLGPFYRVDSLTTGRRPACRRSGTGCDRPEQRAVGASWPHQLVGSFL